MAGFHPQWGAQRVFSDANKAIGASDNSEYASRIERSFALKNPRASNAHLDAGKYYRLNFSQDLIQTGIDKFQEEFDEKKAITGEIDALMPQTSNVAFDLVLSYNVACHIHPDELEDYFKNILALSKKKG